MSKYNHYAKELAEAFRAAQAEQATYLKTISELEEIAHSADEWKNYGTTDGEAKAKIRAVTAAIKLEEIKSAAKASPAWDNYYKTVDSLTERLNAEYEADNAINPDVLDNNTVALMNSGIIKPSDIGHLMNKYSDNRTMQRLVAKYAQEQANKEADSLKRQEWIKDTAIPDTVMDNWHSLTHDLDYLSGQFRYRHGMEAHPDMSDCAAKMQAYFDTDSVQSSINNF